MAEEPQDLKAGQLELSQAAKLVQKAKIENKKINGDVDKGAMIALLEKAIFCYYNAIKTAINELARQLNLQAMQLTLDLNVVSQLNVQVLLFVQNKIPIIVYIV